MSDENNVFMGIEENFISFGKWLLIATFVGAIVGLVGTAFHFCIDYATELRLEYTYLIFLLPLGGALIAYLYKTFGLDKEKGTLIKSLENNTVNRLFTTNSLFNGSHEKITVMEV